MQLAGGSRKEAMPDARRSGGLGRTKGQQESPQAWALHKGSYPTSKVLKRAGTERTEIRQDHGCIVATPEPSKSGPIALNGSAAVSKTQNWVRFVKTE